MTVTLPTFPDPTFGEPRRHFSLVIPYPMTPVGTDVRPLCLRLSYGGVGVSSTYSKTKVVRKRKGRGGVGVGS